MTRTSFIPVIAFTGVMLASPALAGGGQGGAGHASVVYHPSQGAGWTVGTAPSTNRDHRGGNNPGGGVTVTQGLPTIYHGRPGGYGGPSQASNDPRDHRHPRR
jgi:hypothetical protein